RTADAQVVGLARHRVPASVCGRRLAARGRVADRFDEALDHAGDAGGIERGRVEVLAAHQVGQVVHLVHCQALPGITGEFLHRDLEHRFRDLLRRFLDHFFGPGLQRSLERGSRGRPGADGADRGGDRRRHAEDADHLVGDRHRAGHFAAGAAGAAFDRVLAAAAAPAHRTGAVVARLAAAIAETALRLLAGGADPDHGFADHHLLGAGQVDPGLQAQRPAVGYLGPADVGAERGEPGCAFRIDDARATLAVALAVVLFATRRHPGPPRIDGHVGVVADLPGISGAASVLGRATEQAVVAHALGAAGMAVEAEAFHAGGALLVAQ